MRRKISTLFEPRSRARLYPTVRAELDAVRDGHKPVAMEIWPREVIAGDPDHAELVRLARARGLQITERNATTRSGVRITAVYALHPEEAWRIPALHALWHGFPAGGEPWSDGAEALEGHLLGYTDAQIATWLDAKRHERFGWTGITTYLVAADFDKPAGITAVWVDGTRVPRRRPPAWLAGAGLQLARIAIPERMFASVFPAQGSLRIAALTPKHAALLRVPRQRLGPDGWKG
ncbi:MAG: hypothetical protein ABI867_37015 [Kofleriaceae bacterium]